MEKEEKPVEVPKEHSTLEPPVDEKTRLLSEKDDKRIKELREEKKRALEAARKEQNAEIDRAGVRLGLPPLALFCHCPPTPLWRVCTSSRARALTPVPASPPPSLAPLAPFRTLPFSCSSSPLYAAQF